MVFVRFLCYRNFAMQLALKTLHLVVLLSFVSINKSEGKMIRNSFQTDGSLQYYVVFEPENYDPAKQWPVVLFLHGAHERGQDGWKQTQSGIGPALITKPELYPAIVVMPQITEAQAWSLGQGLEVAIMALRDANKHYALDQNRIYLTGISMGGFGTWELASLFPDFFAAIVPIASGKYPDERIHKLIHLPIWAHHSDSDEICPVQATQSMVNSICHLGGSTIRYTEHRNVTHKDTWKWVYEDPEVLHWLFHQKKSISP